MCRLKAQAMLIKKMEEQELLTPEEQEYFRRGRNAEELYFRLRTLPLWLIGSSTGFEALFGYLLSSGQTKRLDEFSSLVYQNSWSGREIMATNEDFVIGRHPAVAALKSKQAVNKVFFASRFKSWCLKRSG